MYRLVRNKSNEIENLLKESEEKPHDELLRSYFKAGSIMLSAFVIVILSICFTVVYSFRNLPTFYHNSRTIFFTQVVSDSLITLAYISIPATLIYLIKMRKDLPFHWIFGMFGAFILSCGITHAFHVLSPWMQLYSKKQHNSSYMKFNEIEVMVKLSTAVISIATALSFIHLIPFALQLPSPSQLETQIHQRKLAQRKVKKQYNAILIMSNMMKKIRDAANSKEIMEISSTEIGRIFNAYRVTVHRINTSVTEAAIRNHPDPCYVNCDAEYSRDGCNLMRRIPLCRFLEQVADTDEPLMFRTNDKDHAHDGNHLFKTYLEDNEIETVICVSTSYNHITNGLILLHFTSTFHCSSNQIAMLEEVAGQIGIALQHALNNEQLELDRDQAQKASTEKTEFLLMMSHEVRTPLNAISGMNAMLKSTPLTAEQQECIKIIDESGDILLGIINSFLDLSKLEISKLELEKREFNLHESLDTAVKLFTSNAKNQKDIDVEYSRDPWLPIMALGDRYRMQQILINIISNAVKFTAMNGKVKILVSCIDEEPRNPEFTMQVAVEDTGIGMNEQQIEQLFKPFSQVHSSGLRRKFGGTGLGLCICKRLSNLMDGDVTVRSELGKGSTFIVSIKLGKVDHDFPQKICPRSTLARMIRRRSSIGSEAANILIAEDNPVNQRVAVALLRKLGYQNIEVVSNGKLAVEAVRRRNLNNICLDNSPFDVILMDLQMPEVDGVTATAEIRNMIQKKDFPYIIALTANTEKDVKNQCLHSGFNAFLGKPFKMDVLDQVIREAPAFRP